jgi:hypothetical protein
MLGNSWVAAQLAASQEGLSSTESCQLVEMARKRSTTTTELYLDDTDRYWYL